MGAFIKVFLVNFLILLSTLQINGQRYPRVNTNYGEIVGSYKYVVDILTNQQYTVKEYLAVPYAKPPLLEYRFMQPQPIDPWHSSMKCQVPPKACIQETTFERPWTLKDMDMSEDCLYMNIWAPEQASPKNKRSVLFFVPGGGYFETSGSASEAVYEGHVLSAFGDIIVVVVNYRIGTLGFWSAQGIKGSGVASSAPGNVALWDVIEALKFVNNHIESFGGDKNSITLAGQGFGSVVVSLLSVAWQARGLYKRQIMQSGSAMWQYADSAYFDKRLLSQKIAEIFGCSNKTFTLTNREQQVVDCMKNFTHPWQFSHPELQQEYFIPSFRDALFENNPRRVLMNATFHFTELLIGISGNEGVPILIDPQPDYFGMWGEEDTDSSRFWYELEVAKRLNYPKMYETFHTRTNENCDVERIDFRLDLADILGDFVSVCPTIYYAEQALKSTPKVYFYDFRYRPSKSRWAKWIGPMHFDEVDFIFGGPFKAYSPYPRTERLLSKLMIKHWSNFIKYGKPSDNWPLFQNAHYAEIMTYLDWANQKKIPFRDVHQRHCNFWRQYVIAPPKAVRGVRKIRSANSKTC